MAESGDPLVSIFTPVYNGGRFVSQSLDASINQTYPNVEVVVVDDCSTDSTSEILREYGGQIRVIRMPENSGAAAASNVAIRACRGEYLSYVASDDLLEKSFVERHLELHMREPEILYTYSDWSLIDEQGRIQGTMQMPEFSDRTELHRGIIRHVGPSLGSAVLSRKAYETFGLFDPGNRYCYDGDFVMRFCAKILPRHIGEPLARYRLHSNQSSHNLWGTVQGRHLTYARMRAHYPVTVVLRALLSYELKRYLAIPWMLRQRKIANPLGAMMFPARCGVDSVRSIILTKKNWKPEMLGHSSLVSV